VVPLLFHSSLENQARRMASLGAWAAAAAGAQPPARPRPRRGAGAAAQVDPPRRRRRRTGLAAGPRPALDASKPALSRAIWLELDERVRQQEATIAGVADELRSVS